MRHRGYIDDLGHLDTCGMYGTDRGLASLSRTFDISLDFAQTKVISHFCSFSSRNLSGIRSVFLGTPETAFTC